MWDRVGQSLNESTVRVLSQFASLLPGVLALILAVFLASVLSWLVGWVLKRFLRSVHFDQQLGRLGFTSIAELSPEQSPSLLVTRVVAWSIILLGFILGLAAFDASFTSQLALQIFGYLPNIVGSILLILVGSIVARYVSRNVLIEAVNMNLQHARLLSVGVRWMVMVLTIAMALDHLHIGSDIVHLAFGILFGGIVFAMALAVGLGSKDLVTRSLDRESSRSNAPDTEELFRHL